MRFRIVGKSKIEIYFSFAAALFGFSTLLAMPLSYQDVLLSAGALTIAFLCALNALLDFRRMRLVERMLAAPWFLLLLVCVPPLIWRFAHIRMFSNR